MQPITVLFFGSQGAGKGTQVKMLMELLKTRSTQGIIHIDMGQELRTMMATGTKTAELTKEIVSVGKRMPDFMPIYLQTKKVTESLTNDEHIIADGLARGADQTRAFDDMMTFFGRDDFQIVHLTLAEDSAVKRLLLRGRADDTEEAIRERLRWNKSDVEPQLELLRSRGRKINTIDGEPDVETIHKNIIAALGL